LLIDHRQKNGHQIKDVALTVLRRAYRIMRKTLRVACSTVAQNAAFQSVAAGVAQFGRGKPKIPGLRAGLAMTIFRRIKESSTI